MPSNLISQLNATDVNSFADESERLQTILAAKALVARLYGPLERVEDLLSSQLPLVAELKIFTDLRVFPTWQERNGGKPTDAKSLADWTGVSAPLMGRLLRHLAIEHVVEEVGENQYAMSPFAVSLQSKDMSCWADYAFDFFMPTISALPAFLASTGYREPTDPKNAAFQFGSGCPDMDSFDYFRDHPRKAATFNTCMSSYASKRASWLQFFPVQDYLPFGADADADGPFLVDVGGNIGHDIQKVFNVFPDLGRNLVLQDRPEVVARAVCDESIQRVAHDFFTPQPVKGARIYYLHSILHDWQRDQAQSILLNIKSAMTPGGHSRILINENVVASRNPLPQMVMFDITMMTLGARERSEADWRELIEPLGLEVLKIWSSPVARESVIEVGLGSSS